MLSALRRVRHHSLVEDTRFGRGRGQGRSLGGSEAPLTIVVHDPPLRSGGDFGRARAAVRRHYDGYSRAAWSQTTLKILLRRVRLVLALACNCRGGPHPDVAVKSHATLLASQWQSAFRRQGRQRLEADG
jgi:hypothetical protein